MLGILFRVQDKIDEGKEGALLVRKGLVKKTLSSWQST
jgi:hypothetical protein